MYYAPKLRRRELASAHPLPLVERAHATFPSASTGIFTPFEWDTTRTKVLAHAASSPPCVTVCHCRDAWVSLSLAVTSAIILMDAAPCTIAYTVLAALATMVA